MQVKFSNQKLGGFYVIINFFNTADSNTNTKINVMLSLKYDL